MVITRRDTCLQLRTTRLPTWKWRRFPRGSSKPHLSTSGFPPRKTDTSDAQWISIGEKIESASFFWLVDFERGTLPPRKGRQKGTTWLGYTETCPRSSETLRLWASGSTAGPIGEDQDDLAQSLERPSPGPQNSLLGFYFMWLFLLRDRQSLPGMYVCMCTCVYDMCVYVYHICISVCMCVDERMCVCVCVCERTYACARRVVHSKWFPLQSTMPSTFCEGQSLREQIGGNR